MTYVVRGSKGCSELLRIQQLVLQLEEFRRRRQKPGPANSSSCEKRDVNKEDKGVAEPILVKATDGGAFPPPVVQTFRYIPPQQQQEECEVVGSVDLDDGVIEHQQGDLTMSYSTGDAGEIQESLRSGKEQPQGSMVQSAMVDAVEQQQQQLAQRAMPSMAEYMVPPVTYSTSNNNGSAREEEIVEEQEQDVAAEQEELKFTKDDPTATIPIIGTSEAEQETLPKNTTATAATTGFGSLDRQERFETLQQHIETLTVEKGELSMCLEQQTNIVRRLTEEHEAMVAKLNDAGRQQEAMQQRLDTYAAAEREMKEYTKRIERELDDQERQNRLLKAKVTMLGKELVSMEDRLVMNEERRQTKQCASVDSNAAAEESKREMVEQELQEMTRRLAESEKRRMEAEEAMKELQQEVDEARHKALSTHHEHGVTLPQAAIVSAIAMDAYASEMDGTEMHILSPEIRALLPTPTWIPGDVHSSSLENINSISGRLYILLQRLEQKLNNNQKAQSSASASLGVEKDSSNGHRPCSNNGIDQSNSHHHHTVSISETI